LLDSALYQNKEGEKKERDWREGIRGKGSRMRRKEAMCSGTPVTYPVAPFGLGFAFSWSLGVHELSWK
jgi:hypothetical protein